jgi:hypothetical protein
MGNQTSLTAEQLEAMKLESPCTSHTDSTQRPLFPHATLKLHACHSFTRTLIVCSCVHS